MPDVELHREIERFRERLLDLSLRNPLLNYRKSKRRTLQFVDELPNAIFTRLVESGKPFTLDFVPDPPVRKGTNVTPLAAGAKAAAEPALFDEVIVSDIDAPAAASRTASSATPSEPASKETLSYPLLLPESATERLRPLRSYADDRLQTNHTQAKLDSLTRYMQREAQTAMQETGINYLFLAIGFLSWRESESSEGDRIAPLILIPVRIEKTTRANGEPQFSIQWDEDDVQSNLSLQKKLARDFDLALPEFSLDSNPEQYFLDVGATIQTRPNWGILREAILGFFSFHKLSMYADIDPSNWDLRDGAVDGSVIEKLICGGTDSETDPGDPRLYAPDYDIDQNAIVPELVLAMDADSSQQSALVDIHRGRSLVIEGPPGTGKSQTITNAIADAMAAGKTVLFVAEKLAALQVVHDRLASLGLDDFCLELHSDAASPRQVFASLQKRLAASYERPHDLQSQRQSLEQLRKRLNTYVADMAEIVGPTQVALYDLLWQIVALRSGGAVFARGTLGHKPVDRDEFQRSAAELRAFGRLLSDFPKPKESPWWGFFPEGFAFRQSDEIRGILATIREATAAYRGTAQAFAEAWAVTPLEAVNICNRLDLDAIRACAQSAPPDCASITARLTDTETFNACGRLLDLIATKDSHQHRMMNEFGTEPSTVLAVSSSLIGLIDYPHWAANVSLDQMRESLNWLTELTNLLRQAATIVEPIQACGLASVGVLADLTQANKLVQLIAHPIVDDPRSVTREMFDGTADSLFRSANLERERLQAAERQYAVETERLTGDTSCNLLAARERLEELAETIEKLKEIPLHSVSIEEVSAFTRWAGPAVAAIDRILLLADWFGQGEFPPVHNFEQFTQASSLVQLARHSAVRQNDCLSEPMFASEGRRTFQHALKTFNSLAARQRRLEEAFHMPAVPSSERLASIVKVLRRHRRSWFSFMNREYREARASLDEFAAIGKKRKLDEWIRDIEDLEALNNDIQRFGADTGLVSQLGSGFAGMETDWESLKTRFDWVHTIGKFGLDFAAAVRLLATRDQSLKGVSNLELKQAEAAFREHFLDEGSWGRKVIDDGTRVPLKDLRERLIRFRTVAVDYVSSADSVSAPANWTCEDMELLVQSVAGQRRIDQEFTRFGEDAGYRQALGYQFAGRETDWQKVETALRWARTVRELRADFSTVTKLLTRRSQIRRDYDLSAASQCQTDVNAHLSKVPQALTGGDAYASQPLLEAESLLNAGLIAIRDGLAAAVSLSCRGTETIESIRERLETAQNFHRADSLLNDPEAWSLARTSGLFDEVLLSATRVRTIFEWVRDARLALLPLPEFFISQIVSQAYVSSMVSICDHISKARHDFQRIRDSRGQLDLLGTVVEGWLDVQIDSILSGATESTSERLETEIGQLPAWGGLCRALAACERLQVRGFCDAAIEGTLVPERLSDSYELTVYEVVAEEAFRSSATLQQVSGRTMQGLRQEFQRFDRKTRDLNRTEIASRASGRFVPEGNARGRVGELTELALIRHESQKQKRHCRIRDLMQRAGGAVQALKPCLMMSPLSVSRFIPNGTVFFDMVIMDEASQIKPEDAIGTMLRAKQIVVVGDPKQLPPTSFFDRLDEELDDNESTQLDNTESVLEAAMKVFQPFRRLRWHYRSRHESLIRFSNSRFYDNDLVVFPSPAGNSSGFGIRHVFVDGATCSGGLNLREAEAVVDEIVRHACSQKGESLGVGTFNKAQRDLVEELLDKRCAADPVAAIALEQLRQQEDGFFIKNLENLQGDERDVVFVCYTYGADPSNGRLMQRFGPINRHDGWRRLNVLITRARKRMVVFSSFHPSDVQGGPQKSRGVNAYKDFLNYAVSGTLDDGGTVTERSPDSPFEVAVCRQIEQLGLEAVPQVGVAGFFVDIGVRRRDGDRSFLLGIECDGATYHSARSARDRDRLREEIIRSRGWKIHRIWSTDWFLDQSSEIRKLEVAITDAVGGAGTSTGGGS